MYDVTAIGELLIDFTPSGTNEQGIALFGRNPGGAPANVLAMINKLGGKTAFIGKVGDDEFGRFLEKTLVNAGIDTEGLLKDAAYLTTLAFVHLSETGDRSFSFYRKNGADLMLVWDEINQRLIDDAKIFHFGSVSLSGQPCRDTLHAAVRYAAVQGKIISYDPNYRSLLWPDEAEARTEISKLISAADILKVSEEEMTLLTNETNWKKGAARLAEEGPAIVLVSRGAKGAYFRCAAGSGCRPAYDVKTVDTTGAGDSFLGAVLYRLRDKKHAELKAITQDELADIIDFANAAGSLTTTRKGAIPALPSAAEIEACRVSSVFEISQKCP
ncbi:MAG: carbohydrate kinase [Treponema sp.]|jgi:fructokinase|nr:carbohydrate kinase [Treponema sp.]